MPVPQKAPCRHVCLSRRRLCLSRRLSRRRLYRENARYRYTVSFCRFSVPISPDLFWRQSQRDCQSLCRNVVAGTRSCGALHHKSVPHLFQCRSAADICTCHYFIPSIPSTQHGRMTTLILRYSVVLVYVGRQIQPRRTLATPRATHPLGLMGLPHCLPIACIWDFNACLPVGRASLRFQRTAFSHCAIDLKTAASNAAVLACSYPHHLSFPRNLAMIKTKP